MISFYSETDFTLKHEDQISKWISQIIISEGHEEGEIAYIFCDDDYLNRLNVEFLDHDSLTDIISFDNSLGNQLNGDIYISVERVRENAATYKTTFINELHRVIIHGILHYCGYKDKSEADSQKMRTKEEKALKTRIFI